MSVDILMYKVQPLNGDELRKIHHMNVSDLGELDGWELKIYSFEEMSKHPARFEHIKDFMRTVELMYTYTDFKACCVEHGMPEDTKCYSYQYVGGKYIVRFGDNRIQIAKEDLNKFTTTMKKTYCIVKCKAIDVDVSNWTARSLMSVFEEVLEENEAIDLSYTPIQLNSENCEILCKALVELYDKDELYPDSDCAQFMIELMRVMCEHDISVFIEFQD